MTGPEHYAEAQRLLESARPTGEENPEAQLLHIQLLLDRAQVHATLALAAATAMGLRSTNGAAPDAPEDSEPAGMHPADFAAWDAAAGTPT